MNSLQMKEYHKKWKDRDPEGYKKHQSNAGKRAHQIYPDMASNNGKKVHQLYPKLASINGKKWHNKLKKEPEKYLEYQSNAGKASFQKQKQNPKKFFKDRSKAGKKGIRKVHKMYPDLARLWSKKGANRIHELYPELMKKWSKKGKDTLRNNKPYIWENVHFDSKEEMQFAKKILLYPIEGINCHISIGTKIFDFFPQETDLAYNGILIEYHPFTYNSKDRNGLTKEEYIQQRQKAINGSDYKGMQLLVVYKENLYASKKM